MEEKGELSQIKTAAQLNAAVELWSDDPPPGTPMDIDSIADLLTCFIEGLMQKYADVPHPITMVSNDLVSIDWVVLSSRWKRRVLLAED